MNISESNISLIEDHHEALNIWRRKNLRRVDLIHIDAHIDFGFYPAKPKEQIIREAKTLNQLKRELEKSLLYQRYQKDFDRQANIGNYIYPAMCEGIVKDFYWVIPGKLKEFKSSLKFIKGILKNFAKQDPCRPPGEKQGVKPKIEEGIITSKLLGRKFVVCILEKLPVLKQKVLLDIDTDFLVISSLLDANNTVKIGKRKRWIRPDRLIKNLVITKKLKTIFTTIAYSVNGGYTPMRYKILGDELAYRLSPKHFKEHYGQRFIASVFFERFESSGKREHYQKAVKLNPSYRAADNNYGPLYLPLRKFSQAEKEFLKIINVDIKNPYPFIGLGNIALEKKDFLKAKKHFFYAVGLKKDLPRSLFGLAQAEFRLKNFKKAKELFCRYQAIEPLQSGSRYFLGCIYENEKDFEKAAACFQDAMRLGLNNIDVIKRLLKTCWHLKAKNDIIKYVSARYKELKRGFDKAKRLSLKKGGKLKGLRKIEKNMAVLDKLLNC